MFQNIFDEICFSKLIYKYENKINLVENIFGEIYFVFINLKKKFRQKDFRRNFSFTN